MTPLVKLALRSETVEVDDWECCPIHGGFEAQAGVFRFAGDARDQGQTVPWSLILKVVLPKGSQADPVDWNYLQRDVLAYQSGLLENLPGGIVALRCFGIVEQAEDEFWMWLEDVTDHTGSQINENT